MPRSRDPVDRKRQNNTTPLRVPSFLVLPVSAPSPFACTLQGGMQTVFAFPLPSCRLAPTCATPLSAPSCARRGQGGGRAVFSPFRAGFALLNLVRKRGVHSGAERYAPTLSPFAPTQVEEDNKRRTRRRSLPGRAPVCEQTEASFAPQQGPETRARSTISRPLPFEQGPGGARRGREGGSGHAASVAGTPPSIRVRGVPRGSALPPFAQPVRVQCDHAEPECMRSGGHRGEAEAPPALRASTTPRARHLRPTFRVPRSRRRAQGGMRKVGHAGVVHAGQHTGRAHIPSLLRANRRPRTGNVRQPCSLPPANGGATGGEQRRRRNGARTRASCASSPSSAYPPLRATKGRVCK